MYIVIEIQTTTENVSTIVNSYPERAQAESKYHQILFAAAVSSVPKHGAVMLTDEGERLKNECYIHAEEEEPEEPVEE
jgi:hypothetical protein